MKAEAAVPDCGSALDVYQTAKTLIERHGDTALSVAERWLDCATRAGDPERIAAWQSVVDIIRGRIASAAASTAANARKSIEARLGARGAAALAHAKTSETECETGKGNRAPRDETKRPIPDTGSGPHRLPGGQTKRGLFGSLHRFAARFGAARKPDRPQGVAEPIRINELVRPK